jgi:general secretion pathway protein G
MIELLIVISIIMILAAMALTQYRNSILYAKEAALKSDLFLMRDAIDQYYADKGKYPESLQSHVSDSYQRGNPRQPLTNTTDTWTTTTADPQPGQLASQTGVYDVKSGSDLNGSDGSRYADW